MLEARCTNGCHMVGGTAERQLIFTGDPERDANTLRNQEDHTALGIFRKAAGLVGHSGGKAAIESDRDSIEKWFVAARLCPNTP